LFFEQALNLSILWGGACFVMSMERGKRG